MRKLAWILLALPLLSACDPEAFEVSARTAPAAVAGPITLPGSAYEAAGELTLPAREALEPHGLHNVYVLSADIVSGGEPLDVQALESLAEMGVRTILSVDGKTPDVRTAERLGMRYVHLPLQYKGITEGELLRLAKTFRELEGPFYVHCFHGVHRGPAAAAIGRLVRDGVTRKRALAEMRQWSGTAAKYEKLYRCVAGDAIPSAADSEAFDWDFPATHPVDGVRGLMVGLTRANDALKVLSKNDWQPDSNHPDFDAVHEASKLLEAFRVSDEMATDRPEDYRRMMAESREQGRLLLDSLQAHRAGDPAAGAQAQRGLQSLRAQCAACHKSYRNR